ncbi:hypothetical protein [Methylobacterium brachythecii]|uniref:Uncharacterized protein n=1 Tax=Methylobacterium brachythecii TaxID=1176177 RepID=A0A7W6ARU8_9HYPH|nr:hypothetical protein [Methylobacterium brachythecii]MBB3904787.1 hypothetical protein [Methylobacterium brachythecii]
MMLMVAFDTTIVPPGLPRQPKTSQILLGSRGYARSANGYGKFLTSDLPFGALAPDGREVDFFQSTKAIRVAIAASSPSSTSALGRNAEGIERPR